MTARDGACLSLWQDNMPLYRNTGIPHGNTYDVAIAGGGITGITTALLLQEAGIKCVVFEAETLCFGTTSGTTAHLNTLLDTAYSTISRNFGAKNAALVADAAARAIELIKWNIRKYSIDCGFEETAAYLFSQTDEQTSELENIYTASLEAGLDISHSSSIPVNIPFKRALRVEKQAKFHPVEYVYALAKAFENAGGTIIQHCRVLNADGDDGLHIETSCGEYKAGAILYATHIPMGVNLLHLRCAPYRSYALAATLTGSNYPEALVYDSDDPYHYYRTHIVNGQAYLIAGGEDHKTAHAENTEQCFRQLEAHVRKYFPVQKIEYRWSSQYYEPADGLPYIGHLPGHPNRMFVATGFGGNGMIYSHVTAELLTDMLLGKQNDCETLFNPNRIKPVAGFVNFIRENADVAKQLLSKLIPASQLDSLAELAPGEAKIIRYEDQTIGLYKDPDGQLHAVNPTCTHMKCTVQWNNAEASWDCPCHGARFSYDGKVLTGPANEDLPIVAIQQLAEQE